MARYYQLDVARWEGEGGASDETAASSNATRLIDGRNRKNRSSVFLKILASIMVVVGSVAYARWKGLI